MDVGVIGLGNVGLHLCKALVKAGHRLVEVADHKWELTQSIASRYQSQPRRIEELDGKAEVYICSVRDENLYALHQSLHLKEALVLHVSGSVEMEVLHGISSNYGVMYFLQTFSKDKENLDLSSTPVCIEANNARSLEKIRTLASSLSDRVEEVDSGQRARIHLAAVFACNFSNLMYSIAEKLMQEKNLDFRMLLPLIEETAGKLRTVSPLKAQTGPAVRGDGRVLLRHLQTLKNRENGEEWEALYRWLSEEIVRFRDEG